MPRLAAIVAFCGALPDILSPHLSLDSRYAALSHTLGAFLLFGGVIGVLAWLPFRVFTARFSLLCVSAYGGHLFCDAITGGIPLLRPLSTRVQGGNYLPYWLWITCDGLLILYLYLVYRWLPLRRKIKSASSNP